MIVAFKINKKELKVLYIFFRIRNALGDLLALHLCIHVKLALEGLAP